MLTRMPKSPARKPSSPASPAEAILAAIRAVPRGQVASYGTIAKRAGLPGRARMVARLLAEHGETGGHHRRLPWHRILRSDGRIAFPTDSPEHAEQAQRLRAEGVDVRNGRVRMPHADALDEGGLDAALWSPR